MPERAETLGPYTLLRKIGAGGMGEVYLARDPRLEREVALKQLPADLRADPERRQRFLREARAAAKLSHPNITAIHEVGEAEGHDYIAFEYVEGETLAEVVSGRRLTLAELIDLALPLADALAYAHERGVIHRDLKAANVMVTPRGHPKLLDFGLAKLAQEEGTGPKRKSTTLTMEGAIFGTPQSMSPEQALGRSVDERSDVFSFGSLLYEMAAGRAAFEGETVMEIMDAVIHREPDELTRLRPDLPAEFAAIVARAMRKEPSERYPSIVGLVADLKHFKRKTESGLVPVARARRPWLPAALLVGVALVAGLAWVLGVGDDANATDPAPVGHRSIAVMGFELIGGNGAPDAGSSNLDRALTSLVTTALAEAGGIDVASSSKVVACLRGAGQSQGAAFDPGVAAEAARAAQVDLMVVGQVLRRASRLVLTAELVDVASGNALDSLRREVDSEEDLFVLAEGLAADVCERLGLAAAGAERIDLQRDLTDSTEAYYKFVAGEMAINEARFVEARRLLEQAIEIDPSFAFAYIRLGIATEWEGDPVASRAAYEGALEHADRLPERWRRLVEAVLSYSRGNMDDALARVEQLIAEGHEMPEVYNTHGELLTHSTRHRDPARARASFLRALEIDPNFQLVLYHVVLHSLELGDVGVIDELLDRLRALDVNPEGIDYLELGRDLARRDSAAGAARIEAAGRKESDTDEYLWCLFEQGRLDDVEAFLANLTPVPASNAYRNKLTAGANLAFQRGRLEQALRLFREASECMPLPDDGSIAWFAPNLSWNKLQAARTAHLLGSLDQAYRLIDEGTRIDPYGIELRFWKARWLFDAGSKAEARDELERMRALASECTSPIAASWVALAEVEQALADGEIERARERMASLDDTPRGRAAVGGDRAGARACGARGRGLHGGGRGVARGPARGPGPVDDRTGPDAPGAVRPGRRGGPCRRARRGARARGRAAAGVERVRGVGGAAGGRAPPLGELSPIRRRRRNGAAVPL